MFDFNSFPFKLSDKTVAYICPKCKYKFDTPIDYVSKRGFHHIYKDN